MKKTGLESTAKSTNKTPLADVTGKKTTKKNAPPPVNTSTKRTRPRGNR